MNDIQRIAVRLLVAGGCVWSVTSAAGAPMNPGMWEMALTVTVDGKSQTIPAVRECIAQVDIDTGNRTLPRPDGNCTLSNIQRTGDRATYDLACTSDSRSTRGHATIDFDGDRYQGKVDLFAADPGGTAVKPLALAINARRTGDCSK